MENEEKKETPVKKAAPKKKTTTKSREAKPANKAKKEKVKFTKKEKVQLTIILLVVVLAIVGIVLVANMKKDKNDGSQKYTEMVGNVEVNNSKGVTKDKQIDDLKIQNTQVKKDNGITYIYADVVNEGKEAQGGFYVFISMKDEAGTEIIGFETMLPVLQPGETTNIEVGSADEFVNAYECTMTKVVEEPKQ